MKKKRIIGTKCVILKHVDELIILFNIPHLRSKNWPSVSVTVDE